MYLLIIAVYSVFSRKRKPSYRSFSLCIFWFGWRMKPLTNWRIQVRYSSRFPQYFTPRKREYFPTQHQASHCQSRPFFCNIPTCKNSFKKCRNSQFGRKSLIPALISRSRRGTSNSDTQSQQVISRRRKGLQLPTWLHGASYAPAGFYFHLISIQLIYRARRGKGL